MQAAKMAFAAPRVVRRAQVHSTVVRASYENDNKVRGGGWGNAAAWGLGRPRQYFANLVDDPFKDRRALYVYSDTDTITSAPELGKFVQDRRQAVADPSLVQEWRIPASIKSPHVSHLIAQPKEYSQRIKEFVQ